MRPFIFSLAFFTVFARAVEFEPNNTIAQANPLVFDSTGQASVSGRVNPLNDLDVFKIVTPFFSGRGNLLIRLTPTSLDRELDAVVQLYDAKTNLLKESDSGFDNASETIRHYSLVGGQIYYVVCRSADLFNSGTGDYTLQISFSVTPGLFGTIRKPNDTTDYPVQILTYGSTPQVINPTRRTWIVIHGWNSSANADNISAAADSIFMTQWGDQVLTLDWSSAADTGILDPLSAESAIQPVAVWAADALKKYGFSGTNLNLVGHSFGSYVSGEIAKRIPGGVNTIVTLDPAVDILGGYSPLGDEVNFARDSFFSWSFHSSLLGNETTPTTADESFIVDSGITDAISAHSNVVFLFAYLITHPEDPFAQFFLLNMLLGGVVGPWVPDQYDSNNYIMGDGHAKGYEAVITVPSYGTKPTNVSFLPLPTLGITATPRSISVSWRSYYQEFVLETSPNFGPAANWSRVQGTPQLVGNFTVMEFQGSGTHFFRLVKP